MGCRLESFRLRTSAFAVLAAVVCALARTAPAASPDGMLLPGEKVQDTLSPDGETRTAGFAGLAGMRCTFVARALPKSRVTPTLAVTDPAGVPVELGRKHKAKGGRAAVSGLVLGTTGNWRISLTTPTGHGGAFELSAAGKAPTRASKKGLAAGDPAAGEVSLDALPGTTLSSLNVTVTSKPSWTPTIELIAPDGTSLGAMPGKGARATMKGLVLESFGAYRVVVTGGTGKFNVAAVLRPPKRALRTWQGAEARPEIRSVSPLAVQNDTHVDFLLDGVGFSTRQTLRLIQNGSTKFAKPIAYASQSGAVVPVDLPGLAPGSYDVQIGTPAANSVVFETPLVLTNRQPGILRAQPSLLPNGATWDVLLTGAGFDPGVDVTIRRRSDGLVIPSAMISRSSHTTADVAVSPGSTTTGPCDIEVRDPDGASTVFPNAFDILGWRAAPQAFRTYTASNAESNCAPCDAAYDPESGRVCIAIWEGIRGVWILLDTATWTVTDTWTVTLPATALWPNPRVAWSPKDRTWALCWTNGQTGYVRIVSGASLQSTVAQHAVGTAQNIWQVDAAADAVEGGWIAVHSRWQGGNADSDMYTLRIASDGTADPANQSKITSGPRGWAYHASIVAYGPDRFLVSYIGADDNLTKLAIRRVVIDGKGAAYYPSVMCASIGDWAAIYQPELALNPEDGSAMLIFTYVQDGEYRPACQLISGPLAVPGDLVSLDDEGFRPHGYIDSVVWNAERREFVISLSQVGPDITVRRVTPEGKIVPAQYQQNYEGVWGIFWCGTEPGTLGLVRAFDGFLDEYHGGRGQIQIHGGPIR